MEKRLLEKLNMYANTKAILYKHKKIWIASELFETTYNQFVEILNEIDESQKKKTDTTEITQTKNQLQEKMIDAAFVICNVGMIYCNLNNDNRLKLNFEYTKSELKKGKDYDIYLRCVSISYNANEIKEKLFDFNINQETLQQFDDMIKEYYKQMGMPSYTIKMNSSIKKAILSRIKKCDSLLKDVIDKMVFIYKTSHPDFYNEYTQARKIGAGN